MAVLYSLFVPGYLFTLLVKIRWVQTHLDYQDDKLQFFLHKLQLESRRKRYIRETYGSESSLIGDRTGGGYSVGYAIRMMHACHKCAGVHVQPNRFPLMPRVRWYAHASVIYIAAYTGSQRCNNMYACMYERA